MDERGARASADGASARSGSSANPCPAATSASSPRDVLAVVAQRGAEAVGARDRGELLKRSGDLRRVDPAGVDEVRERGRAPDERMVGCDGDGERLLGERRPRGAPVSGSRSGSPAAATPSTKPASSSPVATARTIASAAGHPDGDRECGATSIGREAQRPAASSRSAVAAAGPATRRATSARAASSRSRIGSACSSSRSPAWVGATGRRVSSAAPRSASSTAICWETADCV